MSTPFPACSLSYVYVLYLTGRTSVLPSLHSSPKYARPIAITLRRSPNEPKHGSMKHAFPLPTVRTFSGYRITDDKIPIRPYEVSDLARSLAEPRLARCKRRSGSETGSRLAQAHDDPYRSIHDTLTGSVAQRQRARATCYSFECVPMAFAIGAHEYSSYPLHKPKGLGWLVS